jgi:hypothetical protein
MPNDDRQTRALEGIKGYLGDLVKVMTAVNQNMVEFGKILKDRVDNEPNVWGPLEEHTTRNGYRCANKDPKHTDAECVSENGDK